MPATPSSRPGRRPDPALPQLWQQRLRRQQRSGLSVGNFCLREGLSAASFYAWRRRLGHGPVRDARLVPVRILQPAHAPVELVLPGGASLRLAPGCDLAFVRSLIDCLGGAPC